ncbi:MAG TPA: LysE family translocator [Caulobacterales bacterium]|nr:LysE family translocator [Caulobacterales bacterium]
MFAFDPGRYALFLSVMSVMAVTPGPANLFAVATGLRAGPRAALLGVAGMNCATLVWYAAASLGLSALIGAFPLFFRAMGLAGGAYVAWLGLKSLWSAARDHPLFAKPLRAGAGGSFADGFAVQLSNPKIVLFFTAVLPPFIDPLRPAPAQLFWLGAGTITLDALAMSAYAVAGGALARALETPLFRRAFAALVGALLLSAAALILLRH